MNTKESPYKLGIKVGVYLYYSLLLSLVTYRVFFKIDLTDEGYFLQIAKYGNQLTGNTSGFISHFIWLIAFQNITLFRLYGLILVYVSSKFFVRTIQENLDSSVIQKNSNTPRPIENVIATLPFCSYLLAVEIPTPSYNTYSLVSLYLVAGITLRSMFLEKSQGLQIIWTTCGVISFLGALGKPFVLVGCVLISILGGKFKPQWFTLGFVIGCILFSLTPGSERSLIGDFIAVYKMSVLVSPRYEPSQLIIDSFNSIRYSLGGFVITELRDEHNWIILLIFVVLKKIGRYKGIRLQVVIAALLIKMVFTRPEESRNGIIAIIASLCVIEVWQLTRRTSVSGKPIALLRIVPIVFVIPLAFAFGTAAGGLMPKWGHASGIFIAFFLALRNIDGEANWARAVKLKVVIVASIIFSQALYVFSQPQHRSGGLLDNTHRVVLNSSMMFVSKSQIEYFSRIKRINESKEFEAARSNGVVLIDASNYQPTYPFLLGLRPLKGLLLFSPDTRLNLEGTEIDINFMRYVLNIQKSENPESLRNAYILISREFSNCKWNNGSCSDNEQLTKREEVLKEYVPNYPNNYFEVAEIDGNYLLAPSSDIVLRVMSN